MPGIGHYVALSIVGTERLPDSGYLRAKTAQEKLIEDSALPFSIVHATQFFEFVAGIADGATEAPGSPAAGALPAHRRRRRGARRWPDTAVGAPLNRLLEFAGPDHYRMDDFFRKVLAAANDPRKVVTDEHARYFGTELSEHSLVPIGAAMLGETSYDAWNGQARAYPVSSAAG